MVISSYWRDSAKITLKEAWLLTTNYCRNLYIFCVHILIFTENVCWHLVLISAAPLLVFTPIWKVNSVDCQVTPLPDLWLSVCCSPTHTEEPFGTKSPDEPLHPLTWWSTDPGPRLQGLQGGSGTPCQSLSLEAKRWKTKESWSKAETILGDISFKSLKIWTKILSFASSGSVAPSLWAEDWYRSVRR